MSHISIARTESLQEISSSCPSGTLGSVGEGFIPSRKTLKSRQVVGGHKARPYRKLPENGGFRMNTSSGRRYSSLPPERESLMDNPALLDLSVVPQALENAFFAKSAMQQYAEYFPPVDTSGTSLHIKSETRVLIRGSEQPSDRSEGFSCHIYSVYSNGYA